MTVAHAPALDAGSHKQGRKGAKESLLWRQAPNLALGMKKSWSLSSGAPGAVGEMGRRKGMVTSTREKPDGMRRGSLNLKTLQRKCLLTSL